MQDIAVTTSRGGLSKRGLSRRDLDLGLTHRHRSWITVLACFAFLVRYDSGMTSPFSQLCFRSIVHDIAAAMSRRPVCYHTFAKSLRFTRHHTQLPFEMRGAGGGYRRADAAPGLSDDKTRHANRPPVTPLTTQVRGAASDTSSWASGPAFWLSMATGRVDRLRSRI